MTKENELIIQDEMVPDYLNLEKQKEQDKQREKDMEELEKFMDRQ